MPDQQHNIARLVTGLLLAAVAFLGLAQIAFLPPWEGFDETAHWSYIQELSDTGHALGCLTADGILLQGDVVVAGRGAVGAVIAAKVVDGAPPPSAFVLPDGYTESPFNLDPRGFGQ